MKEPANFLGVAPRTITFDKYRIMEDMGLKASADLIQFHIKNQIVVECSRFERTFTWKALS